MGEGGISGHLYFFEQLSLHTPVVLLIHASHVCAFPKVS